ncbi:MAG: Transcriptional regulator, TrmB [Candidatus Moranbacteria bacterium GW2011_GWD2_38_7]|nr:MAG: Transcriptional regulator, TrmB [Parcubacteria group bacterium GW2011_GWC1_38_22]KKQ79606.1 MAG: Transcriptional regulator, TrmB [Candidatus Moranbacteria bacterium GW2011_GWD2_38_7]
MDIKNTLEQMGLGGKKADVYLAALELGSSSVIEISKKAGIKRTTCYDILLDLIHEGLISETSKGKKRLFVGEDPEKIQRNLKNKERLFAEILPQLQSINNVRGSKPKIRFYEGKEGIKEVYEDTLKYNKEILGFASYDVIGIMGKEWANEYLAKRIKNGIYGKGIIPGTEPMLRDYISKDQEQRRSTKVIDAKKYPFSIEINIYGHQSVALMSAKEEIAVIIEGAEIHNTMKLIFELIWDLLPEIKVK